MKCPQCGADCERDEIDVGVGVVSGGPYGCPECHWVQTVADIGKAPRVVSIFEKVTAIVIEELGLPSDEPVTAESIFEELGADSLDRIELTLALEDVFRIEIPDIDVRDVETVGELVTYLERRTAAAA